MAELRAWVLAQLLWNPRQNDRALINEFLEGYYGPGAAPHLRRYLELMHDASKDHNLTCYSPSNAPHLRFNPLAQAEKLWNEAEAAAANAPEFLERIRLGHLAVRYVWLARWTELRKECDALGATWPLADSYKEVADDWMAVANGVAGRPWTRITVVNEAGLTPEKWIRLDASERKL